LQRCNYIICNFTTCITKISQGGYVSISTPRGTLVEPGDFAAAQIRGDAGVLITAGEFLYERGPLGIRKKPRYQHAIFYAGGPDDLILEAEPGGARLRPFHYDPATVLWSSDNPALTLTPGQRARVMEVAEKYKGIPYSGLDYEALALHRLHIPAPGLRKYIASTGHMICSQLVDQCRLELDSHLFTDPPRWPGYVDPEDLAVLIGAQTRYLKDPAGM
jgi:hypothetical protein